MSSDTCCGTCKYHQKENASGEWVCTDHDGEYFGCETENIDKCPDWEEIHNG